MAANNVISHVDAMYQPMKQYSNPPFLNQGLNQNSFFQQRPNYNLQQVSQVHHSDTYHQSESHNYQPRFSSHRHFHKSDSRSSDEGLQKGTEIFVGNLCLDVNNEDLVEFFADCGEIATVRIHNQAQNRKCYAFVRFRTKDQLKQALQKNGLMLKGRKLKITKSNENSTIFIGNIRKTWTNEEVEIKVRRIVRLS